MSKVEMDFFQKETNISLVFYILFPIFAKTNHYSAFEIMIKKMHHHHLCFSSFGK